MHDDILVLRTISNIHPFLETYFSWDLSRSLRRRTTLMPDRKINKIAKVRLEKERLLLFKGASFVKVKFSV